MIIEARCRPCGVDFSPRVEDKIICPMCKSLDIYWETDEHYDDFGQDYELEDE